MTESFVDNRIIYSITALNEEVKQLLTNHFPLIWVSGEISNLAAPASGHIYFSLKDPKAQVRCAMFKMCKMRLAFKPKQGMQVLIRARVGFYQPRGEFQLIAEHMEEAGDGLLQRQLEILKKKLMREGLFAEDCKQPIPAFPKRIGVITSPSGAAVKDVLSLLQQRFPLIPVIIYPTSVQGQPATAEICKAIKTANRRNECDVLLLVRGGGTLEDLWCFNEELVVRSIFASQLPIVTGIGHEIDFTLADFAADWRAPTPSGAAVHASPDQDEWLPHFAQTESLLYTHINRKLEQLGQMVDWLQRSLQQRHPMQKMSLAKQRIAQLQQSLTYQIQQIVQQNRSALSLTESQLLKNSPLQLIQQKVNRKDQLALKLQHTALQHLEDKRYRFELITSKLNAFNPLTTLSRGYSITTLDHSKKLLSTSTVCKIGDNIETTLAQGKLTSKITRIL